MCVQVILDGNFAHALLQSGCASQDPTPPLPCFEMAAHKQPPLTSLRRLIRSYSAP